MNWLDGQERRGWLTRQENALAEAMRYYLGPTGIPDKVNALAQLAQFSDAGDYIEAGEASNALWNDPSVANLGRYATAGAALAVPIVSARGVNVLGDAVTSGADDIRKFAKDEDGAFGGLLARNADKDAYAKATEMARAGVDRRKIWDETGWFQGVDGKWRFEIDDSQSALTDYGAGAITNNRERSGRIESILNTPTSQEYPYAFGEVTVDGGIGASGSFYPSEQSIKVRAARPDDARDVLAHELQHGIQQAEGFASGASPSDMAMAHMDLTKRTQAHSDAMALLREVESNGGDWAKALSDYSELGIPISADGRELARQFGTHDVAKRAFEEVSAAKQRLEPLRRPGQWQDDVGYGPYWRVAGEVEARNVQNRLPLTPEQRRAKAPWETADVPEDDQILVFGDSVQLWKRLDELTK